ncbi:septum formation initiator [Oribacterium sinus]|uniref:septum formation initiator n=1 Tax=Oribacterium sinus TaxID=237576 RepID=UPI0028E81CC5|nr:septum formation initiator [Oribacterium sinus]
MFKHGVTVLGLFMVVALLAIVIFVRGRELTEKNKNYLAMEESLAEEYSKEEQRAKALEEKKVYVKTKEYIMAEAREKIGFHMPDEIRVRPKE